MKITFVMASPNMSGGDRVCAIYAKQLTTLGHAVNIVTPKRKFLPLRRQVRRVFQCKNWLSKTEQAQNHFDALGIPVIYGSTYGMLKEEDVPDADIVVATWWETALWVKKMSVPKGKKFYFIQGLDYVNESVPKQAVEETYHFGFQMITISNWIKESLSSNYGIRDIPIIPNSVDHGAFYSKNRKKRSVPSVGFLFSETECKGVPIALEVLEKLRTDIPELEVFSFGTSAPQTIKIPNYVTIEISPKQERIREIYQQCDVWLCCSLSEGFGLTILEAMACGTPAVSTRCGGPEDIIKQDENGFLCDINDVEQLVTNVKTLLITEPISWQGFSDNALRYAKSYSWEQAAERFETALLKNL